MPAARRQCYLSADRLVVPTRIEAVSTEIAAMQQMYQSKCCVSTAKANNLLNYCANFGGDEASGICHSSRAAELADGTRREPDGWTADRVGLRGICEACEVIGMFTIQTKKLTIGIAVGGAMLAGVPACAQSLQEHMSTCLACHGEKGQSQLPEVPSLGAQPALYTLVELVMFRDKLRITEPMNEMTKGLNDNDLRAASDMIAKLPPPPPVSDTPVQARMERGRALAHQNRCNFCHNVPRLAGQREDYLLKSLRAYKDNSRRGYDAQMSEIVPSFHAARGVVS